MTDLINQFFDNIQLNDFEDILVNESSLQHELSYFIRINEHLLGEKIINIRLEYPINKIGINERLIKKEIDIFISTKNTDYLIELKFPKFNSGFPLSLFNFFKDIKFCEEIKKKRNLNTRCYCVFLTNKVFSSTKHIYSFFKSPILLKSIEKKDNYIGVLNKEFESKKIKKYSDDLYFLKLKNEYSADWITFKSNSEWKYFIIKV